MRLSTCVLNIYSSQVLDALAALKRLTISADVLKKTKVGMTLNNIRKQCTAPSVQPMHDLARDLYATWKKIYESAQQSDSVASKPARISGAISGAASAASSPTNSSTSGSPRPARSEANSVSDTASVGVSKQISATSSTVSVVSATTSVNPNEIPLSYFQDIIDGRRSVSILYSILTD